MLLSTMRVGFPTAYTFLQTGSTIELKTRESSLTEFLRKTRMALPNLKPEFFLKDNKESQIQAVHSAHHIVPSLCL